MTRNGGKIILLSLLIVILIWVARDYISILWHDINYKVSMSLSDSDFSRYDDGIRVSPIISVHPDIRVFTLYAFLNGVADFDQETASSMTPARTRMRQDLREILNKVNPSEVRRWREFYRGHRADRWSYLYYTLTLGVPPLFPHIVPKNDLIEAKTVYYLDGFNKVMASFYQECHIQDLYEKYRATGSLTESFAYDTGQIRSDLDLIYRYPGIPAQYKDYIKVHIIPNPFETHYYAYSAFYRDSLYIIDGPESIGEGLNIHEYLHALLNPIVLKYAHRNSVEFEKVLKANQSKEVVRQNYNETIGYISECLVRAADHRVRLRGGLTVGQYDELEKNDVEQGLVLVPFFSGQLEQYERTGPYNLETFIEKALAEFDGRSL